MDELNKTELLAVVRERIRERVLAAQVAMEAAQQSANEETKSSAGDKYETGRAMAQNDRDMYARQHREALQELATLDKIGTGKPAGAAVIQGDLVKTSLGWILISVSLGAVEFNQERILVVSGKSPVGQALLGKHIGGEFTFQGKKGTIVSVC